MIGDTLKITFGVDLDRTSVPLAPVQRPGHGIEIASSLLVAYPDRTAYRLSGPVNGVRPLRNPVDIEIADATAVSRVRMDDGVTPLLVPDAVEIAGKVVILKLETVPVVRGEPGRREPTPLCSTLASATASAHRKGC